MLAQEEASCPPLSCSRCRMLSCHTPVGRGTHSSNCRLSGLTTLHCQLRVGELSKRWAENNRVRIDRGSAVSREWIWGSPLPLLSREQHCEEMDMEEWDDGNRIQAWEHTGQERIKHTSDWQAVLKQMTWSKPEARSIHKTWQYDSVSPQKTILNNMTMTLLHAHFIQLSLQYVYVRIWPEYSYMNKE